MTHSSEGPASLLQQGDLEGAIEVAGKRVIAEPMKVEPRLFLAELLCLSADWNRVEIVLGQARELDRTRDAHETIQTLEMLVRAERERAGFWAGRQLPSFLVAPGELEQEFVWRVQCHRDGRWAELTRSYQDWVNPNFKLSWREAQYSGIRDVDDLTAGVVEVLTLTGKYAWLSWKLIRTFKIVPPPRPVSPLFLRWSLACLDLRDSEQELYCFLPNTYFFSDQSTNPKVRLGQVAELTEHPQAGLVVGCGRRIFDLGGQLEVDTPSLDGLTIHLEEAE